MRYDPSKQSVAEVIEDIDGRLVGLETGVELEALQNAKLDQLRFRVERLEQGFQALLEDVASNPHLAVEMARSNMRVHDDARERDEKQKQEREGA